VWPWTLVCIECTERFEVGLTRLLCDCGGALDLEFHGDRSGACASVSFREGMQVLLPVSPESFRTVSITQNTLTPLVPCDPNAAAGGVWFKCDYASPSGSFKDRGAAVLAALALQFGADRIVVDSSGNAGAALAMHAARAGIPCEVFAPASTSHMKFRQCVAHGATVRLIEGPRRSAHDAAVAEAERSGAFYASHGSNPHFHHGVKSWAYEVVHQLGRAPEEVVVPYGAGTLVLGSVVGFTEMLAAGLIERVPRIIAARKLPAPVGASDANGREHVVAEGIATDNPLRAGQIERAVAASGGRIVRVADEQILDAQADLARRGFYVESTGAVAWAAPLALEPTQPTVETVIALTGSGLKESPGMKVS
jgi:threonine synthase